MKKLIGFLTLTALLLSACSHLLRKSQEPQPAPTPAPIYIHLRQQILKLSPTEAGLAPSADTPHVWGVLMETGYPQATVSLVSLADGTTSLYFSNGGGIIGGGQHAAVAQASKMFVSRAESYFDNMPAATSFTLPAIGRVKFYILTFNGVFTTDIAEDELGQNQHPLSPLFYRGQEVITQLRLNVPTQK